MEEVDKSTADAAEAEMAANEAGQTSAAAPPADTKAGVEAAVVPAELSKDTKAAAVEATKEDGAISSAPKWPEVPSDSPLDKLLNALPGIIQNAGYDEVYGIHLSGESTFCRNLILQKFLRANANNVEAAIAQLVRTLEWRKEIQPLSLPSQTFSKEKFGGLAFISTLEDVPKSTDIPKVACWNIYGAVTDNAKTFGDLDEFTTWRVAVMEAALARLNLSAASEPIPNYGEGPDPYQMVQIHDYRNISFLRQDPDQKAAAKKAIDTFASFYPETLSRKMFVNVPAIMGWMFSAMKLVLSQETVRKFTVIANGKYLSTELGASVPQEYGGDGPSLEEAEQLKLE